MVSHRFVDDLAVIGRWNGDPPDRIAASFDGFDAFDDGLEARLVAMVRSVDRVAAFGDPVANRVDRMAGRVERIDSSRGADRGDPSSNDGIGRCDARIGRRHAAISRWNRGSVHAIGAFDARIAACLARIAATIAASSRRAEEWLHFLRDQLHMLVRTG